MIKRRKISLSNILVTLFLAVTLVWLLMPEVSLAQVDGLVQAAQCSGTDCGTCNLVLLGNAVIKWVIGFLFIMFAVLMTVAGFKLVTSGGNPAAKDAAKDSFTNAIIGLLIVLSAWLMVDTLIRGLVSSDGVVNGRFFWSEVECTTQTPTSPGSDIEIGGIEAVRLTCADNTLSATELRNAGCNLNVCNDTACLLRCDNAVKDASGNFVCSSSPDNYYQAMSQACNAPNSAGGSYDKAESMGCKISPCTEMACLTSCSNSVTDSSGNNYCVSAPIQVTTPGVTGSLVTIDGYQFDASVAANVVYLRDNFNLRVTSGYRDPARNAAVGGAVNSHHLTGRAIDLVGSESDMQKAAAWCHTQGNVEVLIHSVSSGRHLHCAWR